MRVVQGEHLSLGLPLREPNLPTLPVLFPAAGLCPLRPPGAACGQRGSGAALPGPGAPSRGGGRCGEEAPGSSRRGVVGGEGREGRGGRDAARASPGGREAAGSQPGRAGSQPAAAATPW